MVQPPLTVIVANRYNTHTTHYNSIDINYINCLHIQIGSDPLKLNYQVLILKKTTSVSSKQTMIVLFLLIV